MKTFLTTFFFAVFCASQASALTVYQCRMDPARSSWTGDTVVLAHDPAKGTVLLADDAVMISTGGKPLSVRPRVSGDTLRMRYVLTGLRASDYRKVPNMQYLLVLSTKSGRIKAQANPVGYNSQRFVRTGQCGTLDAAEAQGLLDRMIRAR